MTNRHWYYDSNGKEGGDLKKMFSCYNCHQPFGSYFLIWSKVPLNCAAPGPFCVNQWRQSIHKQFTSSRWDFPQGAASPCQDDTATGLTRSCTGTPTQRFLFSMFALVARSRGKTRTLVLTLSPVHDDLATTSPTGRE